MQPPLVVHNHLQGNHGTRARRRRGYALRRLLPGGSRGPGPARQQRGPLHQRGLPGQRSPPSRTARRNMLSASKPPPQSNRRLPPLLGWGLHHSAPGKSVLAIGPHTQAQPTPAPHAGGRDGVARTVRRRPSRRQSQPNMPWPAQTAPARPRTTLTRVHRARGPPRRRGPPRSPAPRPLHSRARAPSPRRPPPPRPSRRPQYPVHFTGRALENDARSCR
jgi:hypothetical protein